MSWPTQKSWVEITSIDIGLGEEITAMWDMETLLQC